MSWVQILIWLNGAMFVGYGLACLVSPALPAGYAGFELATSSGTVEIVAMYGGLQVGFGVLLLLGALEPEMRDTALWAMAVVIGSLFLARVIGIVSHGASTYNLAAAAYEGTASMLSIVALRTRAAREVTP